MARIIKEGEKQDSVADAAANGIAADIHTHLRDFQEPDIQLDILGCDVGFEPVVVAECHIHNYCIYAYDIVPCHKA
jgi:hypothetical protein